MCRFRRATRVRPSAGRGDALCPRGIWVGSRTLVPTLVPTLVRGIRKGCRGNLAVARCLVKLSAERSLSSNPKPGFDDSTVLLEVEVFDVRVGGQKLAVREVNYR